MRNRFFLLLPLCISLLACQQNEKETPSGLRFEILRKGKGAQPMPGDIVAYHFRMIDSNDSVWNDTYRSDFPVIKKIRDSSRIATEHGLNQMLRMVSQGDSIVVNMAINDYFRKVSRKEVPRTIDTTMTMRYLIRIDSVLSFDDYRKWVRNLTYVKLENQMHRDSVLLMDYLNANNIDATYANGRFWFVLHERGVGELILDRQAVNVNHAGFLLDGKCFGTNLEAVAREHALNLPENAFVPLKVIVNGSPVIRGWHSALKLMRKGTRGTFYFPSPLAYGANGLGDLIPPNAIVIYDIEVVDVID